MALLVSYLITIKNKENIIILFMLSILIDSLTPRERKLQEAKFELITSEASYFKSLTILEKHFINSHSMNDNTILSKKDQKILFGNVNPGK